MKLKGRGMYSKKYLAKIGTTGGMKKTRKKTKAVRKNLALAMASRFPNSPKWNPHGMYDEILARKSGQSLNTFRKGKQAKRAKEGLVVGRAHKTKAEKD